LGSERYGYVGPFDLCDGTFDGNVIDLSVIVSPLPLGVEIGVGDSDDGYDCTMGGESIGLLWRFTDLRWRWGWWWWVSFCLDLRIDIGYVIYCTNGGYVICGVCEG
jgi:hypothetical protein